MRITNREIEWYDDFIRAIEEDYYIDETNDVMYRKLKALEDLEEELEIDLFHFLVEIRDWLRSNQKARY